MSYTRQKVRRPLRGMGSTATDAAAIATAAGTIAAQLIAAGRGTSPTDTTMTTSSIDPTTGMPYGAINPATGLPYGTPVAPQTDYTIPLVIGGLLLVGVGGYFFMRKSKSTPNRRRRVRRNSRRRGSRRRISRKSRRGSRRSSRRRSSRGSYKRRVTKRVQYATRHSGGRWGNPGRIAARIRREEFGRMMRRSRWGY